MNTGSGGWNRRQAVSAAALVTAGLALGGRTWAQPADSRSGTARLDGIDVYYEVHRGPLNGTTVPIVLLHGGALTIEAAFAPEVIGRFADRQPVIAIEQQGHGHTADRPGEPITIDQMIRDTAGVLAYLNVRQSDLVGHSLGGIIATGVAIRHPDIVRKVATLGTPYQLDGFRPDLARMQRGSTEAPSPELAQLLPTEADFAAWRASFERSAPDPTAFETILSRLNTMLAAWPGWSEDELCSIRARMLIAIGDNDYVRIEHAAEFARLVPNARLAVLPGTTHLHIVKRDAWIAPMIDALMEPSL
jgi:pimeloyl-ACP methyl ester carboxylesterase